MMLYKEKEKETLYNMENNLLVSIQCYCLILRCYFFRVHDENDDDGCDAEHKKCQYYLLQVLEMKNTFFRMG